MLQSKRSPEAQSQYSLNLPMSSVSFNCFEASEIRLLLLISSLKPVSLHPLGHAQATALGSKTWKSLAVPSRPYITHSRMMKSRPSDD